MKFITRSALSLAGLVIASPLLAQSNDFGVQGILDIPSARMESEGTFTAIYSRKDVADIYAIAYQVLPRVEASFRYTIFNARELSPIPSVRCLPNASFCDGLRDRSFEVKVNVWEETEYLPQVSAGIRDLLGTGAWQGEYIAGSKNFGNLDLTLGMGWGRFAERAIADNPLGLIIDAFNERNFDGGALGGDVAFEGFFRGPEVGLFGGVRYHIPRWNLDLLVAYNSDSYARERTFGTIPDADPLSFGVDWEAIPGLRLGVSWQQGNQLAFKLSSSIDTKIETPRKRPERFGAVTSPPATTRTDLPTEETWWPRIVNDAEASGLLLRQARQRQDGVLELDYSNRTYQLESDAIRRVLALTDLYIGPDTQEIILTGDTGGQATHSLRYQRPAAGLPPALALSDRIEWLPAKPVEQPTHLTEYRYPNGEVNLGLDTRLYLFDPDFPLLYQVSLEAVFDVDFGRGWSASGTWVQSLKSQFDRIRRGGESDLPPVRTLQRDYLQQGQSGIDELTLVNRGKISPEIFYQIYGGILEEMYAGVGAEMLWRPYDSRWAIGAYVIGAQQREFDKGFGLRDYRVVTGHVSAYWASPFYNFDFAIHAGRYLAKDVGATFEVQKRFSNGWSLGAFATLTNVPFEAFGEGSFDKGLIFRIPFDLYAPRNTRGSYRTILRSINRDGARKIENWPSNMWERLRHTHSDWLRDHQERAIPD